MFLDFLRDERFEASANSASLHVALNTNAQRHDYLNLRYHAPGKPTKRFRMVSSKFLKSVVETWACLLSTAISRDFWIVLDSSFNNSPCFALLHPMRPRKVINRY